MLSYHLLHLDGFYHHFWFGGFYFQLPYFTFDGFLPPLLVLMNFTFKVTISYILMDFYHHWVGLADFFVALGWFARFLPPLVVQVDFYHLWVDSMGGIAFNKVVWEHKFKIWAALPLGRVALSPLFRWAKVQGVYDRPCCYIGLTAVVGPCCCKMGLFNW